MNQLAGEIRSLKAFSGADGDGAAAKVIRNGQATLEKISNVQKAMATTLKSKDADAMRLGAVIDTAIEEVNQARVAIYRVQAAAEVVAAIEDKRSLLFKDLNDKLVGDAVILRGRQLFIDDYIIENLEGARKVLNQPVKHPRNPLIVADKPWEKTLLNRGSVIYDEQEKLFKMWYSVYTADLKDQLLCYATSLSLIHI